MNISELAAKASPESVALARRVLEQDVADQAWTDQVGPALSQRDVARLLGKSEQAVSKAANLVRVYNRDGRPVYPVVQFDGRRVLPGVAEIVHALSDVVDGLTIASWLTADNPSLDDARPVDVLRTGAVADVVALAHRLAARLAA